MKKIIVLLCLVLAGCATVPSESKIPPQATKAEPAITMDPKEIDNIIGIFSEAIKNNPDYAGAYYNRAVAYYYKNEYDKSWQDVHKAQDLGLINDPMLMELVTKLKKASGKEM